MLASVLLCFLSATASTAPALDGHFIFPPNPFHNHGSSIVQTPDGDFIAAWFHGSGERKADDVCIQGARLRRGESQWSEPFLMADTPDIPDCNPALFMDPRGVLWLFWIVVHDNQWQGSILKYRTATQYSQDGPPQWDWQELIHARPKNLEEQFLALTGKGMDALAPFFALNPSLRKEVETAREQSQLKLYRRLGWMTRLHPIMTQDNRMLLGLYSDLFNCSLAAATSDWGKTWTFSEPIMDPEVKFLGNIQPSFTQRKNGEIVAYMRDNGIPKYIRSATSTDGGMTWSALGMLPIRNPGSSIECIALKNGHWVMVCNDTLMGRHKLSVYLSTDEGETWPHSREIEVRTKKDDGNFSYPSVIQAQDGSIHCTYSYSGKDVEGSTIKHAWFTEDWITSPETR